MNPVLCQDEILQMMYWMRGEQIGREVRAEQLNRFLNIEGAALEKALQALLHRGLLVASGDGYALTERGVAEAGRRFMDEFSSVLGKDDHLSCSDPACDCHSDSWNGSCRGSSVEN